LCGRCTTCTVESQSWQWAMVVAAFVVSSFIGIYLCVVAGGAPVPATEKVA
jgi:hypothetical protein